MAEPTRRNYVSCLSLNAGSVVNKGVDLCSRLSSTSFDLVAVSETWLDSAISSAEISPGTYHMHRKDRSRNGGGILLACSQESEDRSSKPNAKLCGATLSFQTHFLV